MPKATKYRRNKPKNSFDFCVEPGITPVSPEVNSDQFRFIVEFGPYFRQATRLNEQMHFMDAFLDLWFAKWPELPVDSADVDFAYHRQSVTRKKVLRELRFTGAFSHESDQPWRGYLATKTAEFHAKKANVASTSNTSANHSRPRPRPRPKVIKQEEEEPSLEPECIVIDD
ncbi:hypothetical protein JR316_0010333 [Psilocybe cubensis]|uniref:Uncharacterized protein n=2 Tax=Psilocybe cubensis TaxID=181762 RepID=A0A8H8CHE6_PSICU|nr:hypothetical protein JR316_0010333 [Psilocybe cubensis]KAH9478095.1 hypothetical protein JR316_0010333 [Psilocybe cubensis]